MFVQSDAKWQSMIRIMEEERDYYKTEYETLRKKKGAGKSPTNKEKVNNSNLNYIENIFL